MIAAARVVINGSRDCVQESGVVNHADPSLNPIHQMIDRLTERRGPTD